MKHRITPEKAIELCKKINRFSYFANPFYLYSDCTYETVNGEDLPFEVDAQDNTEKSLFVPSKIENIKANKLISIGYDEDIEFLKKHKIKIKNIENIGQEYFYSTNNFITLAGKDFKSFRKAVNHFEKIFSYKVLNSYPKDKVIDFIHRWDESKKGKDMPEVARQIFDADTKSSLLTMSVLDKIPHKGIYVEVEGKLAGFCLLFKFNDKEWAGLMQKTDFKYEGLSRFLYCLKAKEMGRDVIFTTANDCGDPKLAEFKESLRPVFKKTLYTIELE